MSKKLEDHTPDQAPMVSYVHVGNPNGVVFVQYKHDPLPSWAFDVRDVEEKKREPNTGQ